MPTFTVTLQEGETIVLPSDAIITGVFVDGDAEVTSSCTGTLPISSNYKCGVFYMNVDADNEDNHPNDETDTYFTKLFVGDIEYDFTGEKLNDITDPESLNQYIPDQGLVTITHINRFEIDDTGDNKRKAVYVYFKVAEPFFDKLLLQITSHVGDSLPNTQYYKPLTEDEQAGAGTLECEDYPF